MKEEIIFDDFLNWDEKNSGMSSLYIDIYIGVWEVEIDFLIL